MYDLITLKFSSFNYKKIDIICSLPIVELNHNKNSKINHNRFQVFLPLLSFHQIETKIDLDFKV